MKEFIKENKTHKIKILYCKQPSFIHKVEYTNNINELLQSSIHEHDEALDKLIKTLIANVNFGLLEKGGATAHFFYLKVLMKQSIIKQNTEVKLIDYRIL